MAWLDFLAQDLCTDNVIMSLREKRSNLKAFLHRFRFFRNDLTAETAENTEEEKKEMNNFDGERI